MVEAAATVQDAHTDAALTGTADFADFAEPDGNNDFAEGRVEIALP